MAARVNATTLLSPYRKQFYRSAGNYSQVSWCHTRRGSRSCHLHARKKNQNKKLLRKWRKRRTDNELEATTRDISSTPCVSESHGFSGLTGHFTIAEKINLTFKTALRLHLLDTGIRRRRFRWACPPPFPCLHRPTARRARRSLSSCS